MPAAPGTSQTPVPITSATARRGSATTSRRGDDEADAMLGTRRYPSPVGELVLIAGPGGLAAVLWPDDDRRVRVGEGVDVRTLLDAEAAAPSRAATTRGAPTHEQSAMMTGTGTSGCSSIDVAPVHRLLEDAVRQLDEYFAGTRHAFDLRLAPVGTEFQVAVWQALAGIGYGETATYAQQASRIGRPTAVRAVGAATGRNPLSIVLPCHRVVGSDGRLTGFAGGLDAKAYLLEHEARHRRR